MSNPMDRAPGIGAISSLGGFQIQYPQAQLQPPRLHPHPFAHVPRVSSMTNGGGQAQVETGPRFNRLAEIPCKFFTFGACRKGDSCPFSHEHSQITIPLQAPPPAPFAPSHTTTERENTVQTTSTLTLNKKHTANLQRKEKELKQTIDDSMQGLVTDMQKDFVKWEKSNIWKLSAYGLPGKKTIDGFRDKSPEQVHWELMKNDDVQLTRLVNLHQAGIRQRKIYCASPRASSNAIKKSMGTAKSSEIDPCDLAEQFDCALNFESLPYSERVKMFYKDTYGTELRPDFKNRTTLPRQPLASNVHSESVLVKELVQDFAGMQKEIPKTPQGSTLHALTKTKINLVDFKDDSFVESMQTHQGDGSIILKQGDTSLTPLCSPKLVALANASMSSEKINSSLSKTGVPVDSHFDFSNQLLPGDEFWIGEHMNSEMPGGINFNVSPISIDKSTVTPRKMLHAVRKSPIDGPSTSTPKTNDDCFGFGIHSPLASQTFNQSAFQEFHTALSFNSESLNFDECLMESHENSLLDQDSRVPDTSETGTTKIENEVFAASSLESSTTRSRKKKFFKKLTRNTKTGESSFGNGNQLDDSKDKCTTH